MRSAELNKYLSFVAILILLQSNWSLSIAGDLRNELPAQPSGKVLPPEKFVGKVSLGYKAAQTIPDICSKLFCYCGCDLTDKHTNLLDCFTCMHGMDCDICLDEAIVALNLKQKGESLAEIQKTIDDEFGAQYPWEKPSPTLIKYRQTYEIVSKNVGTVGGGNRRSGKCCLHSRQQNKTFP